VIQSVNQVSVDKKINIRVSDGELGARITFLKKNG
jgi:hypothetical protein